MENFNDYDPSLLPSAVLQYLDAHDEGQHNVATKLFAKDALVIDDGKNYVGPEEIGAWIDHSSSEFEFVSTRIGQLNAETDKPVVLVRVDGNFPGGTVALRYQFEIAEGLIVRLVIEV